jgi:hypothetical protein
LLEGNETKKLKMGNLSGGSWKRNNMAARRVVQSLKIVLAVDELSWVASFNEWVIMRDRNEMDEGCQINVVM